MNTEIYLTVKNGISRLVITGKLWLLREFLATVSEKKKGEINEPLPEPPDPFIKVES